MSEYSNPVVYSDEVKLEPELHKEVHEVIDKLSIDDLRDVARYINQCANKACEYAEDNITLEDYLKAKKGDDNEEGEEEGNESEY